LQDDGRVSRAHVTLHFLGEVSARLVVHPLMTTTEMLIQKMLRTARPYVEVDLVLILEGRRDQHMGK
jgi:hypothetical protein